MYFTLVITLHYNLSLLHIFLKLVMFWYIFTPLVCKIMLRLSHDKVVFGQDPKLYLVEKSPVLRLAFRNTDINKY